MQNDILIVESLSKEFKGLKAVNDVSLCVKEGEILGLIGPNGAGKTTFFNCISGYYVDYKGKVEFDGVDVTGFKSHDVCTRGMVRTFQIVKPFGQLSVFENVMVGAYNSTRKKNEAEAIAKDVIDFVGIGKLSNRVSSELNIGDQRKLEMARALATQPKMLLLDEVMAGLNPTEGEAVIQLIKKIRDNGITILMVEHIMDALMELSDRVLVFDAGCRIALGTPEEVSNDPRVIESYLGSEDD